MKIVSLLPAATEMVCLLGLEKNLVGISDDNDYPASILKLPKITASTITNSLSSLEIDKRVKAAKHRGSSVFHIDQTLLAKLAPDLIFTQELCPVCAPAFTDVEKAARKVLTNAKIISFEPHTINDIFENIREVAKATQTSSLKPIKSLKSRLSIVSKKIVSVTKPSVLIIEWLDPLMIAGHWVPEMVERAGGQMLVAKQKEPSQYVSWEDIVRLDPDIIIIAPCGFDIKRTVDEIGLITNKKGFKNLKAVKNKQVFLIDGNAYLTRPGPRIVDGVEILAEIFHPHIFFRKYPASSWQTMSIYY
jgi:iron complex transport system substrate-binding protein